ALAEGLAAQINRMRAEQMARLDGRAGDVTEMAAGKLIREQQKATQARLDLAAQQLEEFQKRAGAALQETAKLRQEAEMSELDAMQRIRAERELALKQYGLTAEAIKNVNVAFGIRERQEQDRIRGEGAKVMAANLGDYSKQVEGRKQADSKQFMAAMDLAQRRALMERRSLDEYLSFAQEAAETETSFRLLQVRAASDASLQARMWVAGEETRITKESINRQLELATEGARRRAEIEILEDPAYRLQIEERLELQKQVLRQRAGLELRQAEMRGTLQLAEMQREEYTRTFDRLKRSAEGVFDSLTARGRSFADIWKTAMLTAIKEVVTSQAARMLMGLFGGGPGGGYAPFGQRGAMAGGGGGLMGLLGMGGFGTFGGFPGMPGGTPGFAGPVRSGGAVGGAAGGGFGGFAGFSGMAAGYKGMLAKLGALGSKSTTVFDEMGQATTFGGKGIGGAGGGAMLLGGGILAMMGLQRGGLSGLGMTTAGGALMGAKFGGPVGALIGGGIGFGAGLVRMLFKGATDKTRNKIQQIYGLDVKDKGLLQQIVEMAKSTYGGNVDVAVRSPQIRDMLELYAMATGQKFGLNPDTVRPTALVQSGGQVFQQVQYDAGRPFAQQSAFQLQESGKNVFYFDGPALTAIMQGQAVEAIANDPRAVAAATTSAARQNSQRREITTLGLAPGTLLR
nr:hypothetical protein [Bryobacterales bacterium]